jgi:RNA methyltransferase, TrmH family
MTDHRKVERTITNRNHPEVKRIMALHTRAERERTGLFYAEGLRFVAQALRHNARIERAIYCPQLATNPLARKLQQTMRDKGLPVLDVSAEVMRDMSCVNDSQGIAIVAGQRWQPLEKVKMGGKLCWVALDVVQSAGNLGTMMRTADAAGAAGLILLGGDIDPYDPATVRASMGAIFLQRFVRTTPRELAEWKQERSWVLAGTSPSATHDYRSVRYDSPTILLLGGERKGLSAELQAICDVMVSIPMVGHRDSLNIAVAAGIVLYEIFAQRNPARITGPKNLRGVQTDT